MLSPEMVEKHHLDPFNHKANGKSKIIQVCVHCGDQIHQLFSRKELRDHYNTLEKLQESKKVQKWIKWVRKRNPSHVTMKKKKKKR